MRSQEGVIVQLGGQTALKLAEKLERYGVKILGTSFDALDLAEDRGSFSKLWNPMIFHSQNMVLSKVLNGRWSFLMIWDSLF